MPRAGRGARYESMDSRSSLQRAWTSRWAGSTSVGTLCAAGLATVLAGWGAGVARGELLDTQLGIDYPMFAAEACSQLVSIVALALLCAIGEVLRSAVLAANTYFCAADIDDCNPLSCYAAEAACCRHKAPPSASTSLNGGTYGGVGGDYPHGGLLCCSSCCANAGSDGGYHPRASRVSSVESGDAYQRLRNDIFHSTGADGGRWYPCRRRVRRTWCHFPHGTWKRLAMVALMLAAARGLHAACAARFQGDSSGAIYSHHFLGDSMVGVVALPMGVVFAWIAMGPTDTNPRYVCTPLAGRMRVSSQCVTFVCAACDGVCSKAWSSPLRSIAIVTVITGAVVAVVPAATAPQADLAPIDMLLVVAAVPMALSVVRSHRVGVSSASATHTRHRHRSCKRRCSLGSRFVP